MDCPDQRRRLGINALIFSSGLKHVSAGNFSPFLPQYTSGHVCPESGIIVVFLLLFYLTLLYKRINYETDERCRFNDNFFTH
jgi:hypothetical protein